MAWNDPGELKRDSCPLLLPISRVSLDAFMAKRLQEPPSAPAKIEHGLLETETKGMPWLFAPPLHLVCDGPIGNATSNTIKTYQSTSVE